MEHMPTYIKRGCGQELILATAPLAFRHGLALCVAELEFVLQAQSEGIVRAIGFVALERGATLVVSHIVVGL